MAEQSRIVRVKVSPQVAGFVGRDAPRELQMQTARGAVPLSERDLAVALFLLGHSSDAEIRAQARSTLSTLPPERLQRVVSDPLQHPQLLDFIARLRLSEPLLMAPLLANPAVADVTLVYVAGQAAEAVLTLLAGRQERLDACPDIFAALLANTGVSEKFRLGLLGGDSSPEEQPVAEATAAENSAGPGEEEAEEDAEPAAEEVNASKYQQSLEMAVAEKIKYALTGDKEWRTIFLKDPNKLVSSAVLKNPRIGEAEVLAVARNRSASDELIRLILLNREWVKHYEIKKALVMHPRTPLPKALRFMAVLSEKDVKALAKSRNVSQPIVNNARRMLMAKQRRGG